MFLVEEFYVLEDSVIFFILFVMFMDILYYIFFLVFEIFNGIVVYVCYVCFLIFIIDLFVVFKCVEFDILKEVLIKFSFDEYLFVLVGFNFCCF